MEIISLSISQDGLYTVRLPGQAGSPVSYAVVASDGAETLAASVDILEGQDSFVNFDVAVSP